MRLFDLRRGDIAQADMADLLRTYGEIYAARVALVEDAQWELNSIDVNGL